MQLYLKIQQQRQSQGLGTMVSTESLLLAIVKGHSRTRFDRCRKSSRKQVKFPAVEAVASRDEVKHIVKRHFASLSTGSLCVRSNASDFAGNAVRTQQPMLVAELQIPYLVCKNIMAGILAVKLWKLSFAFPCLQAVQVAPRQLSEIGRPQLCCWYVQSAFRF